MKVKINSIQSNLKNPRIIKDNKFKKLAFNCSLVVKVPAVIFISFKGKATPILALLLKSSGFILFMS